MSSSLGHMPGDSWEFDSAVTDCFDDMFARSIPDFHNFRELCFYVGNRFIQPDSDVVDLGCSRGGSLEPFVAASDDSVRFVGLECSKSMLQAAQERFKDDKRVIVLDCDLKSGYTFADASLTLSIFTLQFIAPVYRRRIIRNVFDSTRSGGAFILAEKIEGLTEPTRDLLIDTYHGFKHRQGYSLQEIEAKRKSLEGVLTPYTDAENRMLLLAAGFNHVECFWRSLNFAAWIAIKND